MTIYPETISLIYDIIPVKLVWRNMKMETNNNKKPFYKNKWLWIALAVIAVPLWPFILSFFVGRKIYAGSMGKKLVFSRY